MIRFIALSLFIHLAFFYAITWKKTETIEDPIVSVSLVENESQTKQASRPRPKPSGSSTNSQTKAAAAEIENELPPSTGESSEAGSDLAGGNVSVKPRVLKSFKPAYPQEAKAARIEGPVKLSVLINTDGLVQEVKVLEGPGHGLNETAQEALKKFVFSPAEKEGVKVAARIVFVYRFRLESR